MDELASLQESAREMAFERFRIIQPHLEQDRSLSLIAMTTNIPYRTIHRWLTRYRRFGLAALARKAREDRGKRRALSPDLCRWQRPWLWRFRHFRDIPSDLSDRQGWPDLTKRKKSYVKAPDTVLSEWRFQADLALPTDKWI